MHAAEWEEKLKEALPHTEERILANRKKIEERIRMEQSKIKRFSVRSAAAVFVMALAAVLVIAKPDLLRSGYDWMKSLSGGKAVVTADPLDDGDEKSLKVLVYMNESNFMDKYGRLIMLKKPNIAFDIVIYKYDYNQQDKAYGELKRQIEIEKPDLIYLSDVTNWYGRLVKDGFLVELDPLIKKDKFDLDSLHPSVPSTIRAMGDGKLHALAPTMKSKALFYNKDMFDQYQIPYPRSKMSWEELLVLASQFPAKKPDLYGLQASGENDPFQAVDLLSAVHALSPISKDGTKVDLQTNEWRQLWNTVIAEYKNKTLYNRPGMEQGKSYSLSDLAKMNGFLSGKTAMEITSHTELGEIAKMKENGLKPFSIGIVTVPVEPGSSDAEGVYGLDDLLAVSANSENRQAAWEVLRYINSDEMAQLLPKAKIYNAFRRNQYPLLSRPSAMIPVAGIDPKPFYELKAAIEKSGRKRIPNSLSGMWASNGSEELRAVLDGSKHANDALISLESKLQQQFTKTSKP
ncbi:ABC transporter substrate-binding protein [Paenibacillus sp. MBLB4367]|uniref:ABC transporter substrate-binding protein n=1 Tax=Paenibacillus sp. MBLB4367 TaxID=3384767 RepID=UPI0039082670